MPKLQMIMDTWTQQKGLPLIVISREENTISATQKRFHKTSGANDTDSEASTPFDYKWYIPLNYYTDKEPDVLNSIWMNMTNGAYILPLFTLPHRN